MRTTRFVFSCHRGVGGALIAVCGGAHQDWSPREVADVVADIDTGVHYAVPWSQGPIAVEVRGDAAGGRWLHSSGRQDGANELDALATCTRHGATPPDEQAVLSTRTPGRPRRG
ncbi:MAG: hypothetical protein JWQ53_43 [Klenkia sp.]|nr:hypothetical protein [Klenkia sp.]